ncbi:MAG TPA: response regulator [Chitinophagaceae bacterium]|jgi:DNA-binding response OmpR family regulator|nr:response regulator [Chitinophagaceae bacterium]
MDSAVKILIVDDEPDICYFLSINLAKRGFETAISNTLADAEKKIRKEPPALLLLDNHLPDGMGIDFLNNISPLYPDMKIIMITAHDSPQDRSKAYTNGSSFFLSKPFTIAAINQVVDLVLTDV